MVDQIWTGDTIFQDQGDQNLWQDTGDIPDTKGTIARHHRDSSEGQEGEEPRSGQRTRIQEPGEPGGDGVYHKEWARIGPDP